MEAKPAEWKFTVVVAFPIRAAFLPIPLGLHELECPNQSRATPDLATNSDIMHVHNRIAVTYTRLLHPDCGNATSLDVTRSRE